MKTLRLLLVSIFVITSYCDLFAQEVWEKGYIVKDDGKIMTGLIMIPSKSESTDICKFKRFDLAEELKYDATQLKAFSIYSGSYYSSITYKGHTSFCRCLVNGGISLFSHRKGLFLSTPSGDLIKLTSGKSLAMIMGEEHFFSDFKTLLKEVLKDDPGTIVSDKLKLRDDEISSLVLKYNKNKGYAYVNYAANSTSSLFDELENSGEYKFRWGVVAFNSMSLYSVDNEKLYLNMSGFHPDISAGLFLNYRLGMKTGKPELHVEALLRSSSILTYNEELYLEMNFIRRYTTVRFTGIKIPVTFRIHIPGERFGAFASLGASLSYLPLSEYIVKTETERLSLNSIRTTYNSPANVVKTELAGIAGFGLQYPISPRRKISLEGRAEYGTGIIDLENPINRNLKVKQTSLMLSVLCSYSF